ncbi:Pap 25a associated domain family [Colletotrichum higginsianum IMI 349063]|uniref:polynucleotide adenylyltransferase n=2 Tax=Colletotrichum higginsianum (strain IMI 349063) TaxID=759273 RepID=A0A1B7Y958_COLHI|nr:Pap 25a associated domain family [Colletotrichum higginsianum IMI 349063]OBR08596.1 Pap 25a associated domain family [Colletotrichum higginsianum IMI 349063]
MESRATTTESKHTYPTSPWIQTPTIASSASATYFDAPSRAPAQLDFWPLLFPQQASVYQAQLLHYTNLVSPGRGGGLQQPQALPQTTVATPQIQAAPRSRSSSKVSNKDSSAIKGNQGGHGHRAVQNKDKGDRAVITGKDAPPKMQQQSSQQPELSHPLPARPAARTGNGQSHSNSMPSTPQQHARNFSFESREPSPTATNNHSPRSAYSETNSNLPSLRPLPPRLVGGCQYETSQMNSKRRMPYSIGSDKLERTSPDKIKSKLSEDEERKLTTDMRELYDRLTPTEKVEENRQKLVVKLEKIFNEEWPGNDIRVHLFGSSGNLLCSDDSDVDICITTPWKELEGVCVIADLLARKGMKKVVCISAAKVPIVKIWDPELGLACDMNVNNTLALENTRMVRTYVEIDPRVRPLAMIVKYWTRQRIVNDAAFGGTLSSYTWICLIIGFLQLRDPPVLPSLHQRQHQRLPKRGGQESAFADDLDKLRGFGDKNKASLGELLFQFFRFYAHEFDYDKNAISIRLGRKVTKQEKGWHIGINNHLCVEEPFNTIRNLGNTADEYSFRGLHLELRRAFNLISEGKLDECCEKYVYPKEETPTFQRPPTQARPVMIRSSSQQHSGRGGRGNYRGRHSNNFHRNTNSNRRASSSVAYDTNTMYMPSVAMTPQELAWYAQQAQSHQQYPALVGAAMAAQLQQENNIRFQLYTQSQVYQQVQAQMAAQMHAAQRMQGSSSTSQQGSERPRTNSFDNPPLSAPIAGPQDWYSVYGVPMAAYYGQAGFAYPSSPATAAANSPEYRRGLQRSSATPESGASTSGSSLRSQSQPASRSATGQQVQGYPGNSTPTNGSANTARQVNGAPIPSFIPDDADFDESTQRPASNSPASDEGAYLGYYVSDASSPARSQGTPNAIAFGDTTQPAQGRRRLSTEVPQTILDRRMRRTSRSPSPLGHTRAYSTGGNAAATAQVGASSSPNGHRVASRPLIVNGTGSSLRTSSTPSQRHDPAGTVADSNTTEELSLLSPGKPLQIQGLGISGYAADQGGDMPEPVQTPVIVNGTTTPSSAPNTTAAALPTTASSRPLDDPSFRDRIALMSMNQYAWASQAQAQPEVVNGTQMSLRQRAMSRQQSGVIAPLDLATRDNRINGHQLSIDAQHLSPINETRSPSPTVVRKGEYPLRADQSSFVPQNSLPKVQGEPPVPTHTKGSTASHSKQAQSSAQSPKRLSTSTQRSVQVATQSQAQTSSQAPTQSPKVNGIRENGHTRGVKSESHGPEGTWQKATKGRRKGADAKNQQGGGFVPSEQPPKHEADRKGG